MVQAILQGRKTKTRRIFKCKRIPTQDIVSVHPDGAGVGWIAWAGRAVTAEKTKMTYPGDQGLKCPYGQPGDLLWVRETHAITFSTAPSMKQMVWYKADNPVIPERVSFKWHPSIHMPKGAARIWLQVTDVRVERLQDISGYDVLKEGVGSPLPAARSMTQAKIDYESAEPGLKKAFSELWSKINGADSWPINPWLWVISFEVLSTTGRPAPQLISKNS
jgi:hypothetical protein